jgi:hypothetical protein
LGRREAGRPKAASDEQDRCVGGRRDRHTNRPEPLGTPAIRQPEHEHARAGSGLNDPAVAGRDQHGLGDDADDLLDEQRGAGEQPARVAAPECRVCLGAEQTKVGVE